MLTVQFLLAYSALSIPDRQLDAVRAPTVQDENSNTHLKAGKSLNKDLNNSSISNPDTGSTNINTSTENPSTTQ